LILTSQSLRRKFMGRDSAETSDLKSSGRAIQRCRPAGQTESCPGSAQGSAT
jgi:hypothetical protein